MDKAQIIDTQYVAVTREQILAWLAQQGACEVEINLNAEEGSVFIKSSKIKKKGLNKWAYFPIKDERNLKD